MNRVTLLLITCLVLTSWAKAGLGNSWNPWIIDGVAIFCLVSILVKHPSERPLLIRNLIPVFFVAIYVSISLLNPSYKTLSPEEWYEMNIDHTFSMEQNIEKTNSLRNGFRNIISVQEKDPGLAIALFYDLKNRYNDRFGLTPSPCTDLLILYEKKIKLEKYLFLPSCPISSKAYLFTCIHFILLIMFGVIMYSALRSRREIRLCVLIISINAGLLALAGIIQKINYVPGENLKEIFGIWDTPEPRYFYASFTYKNHWSCFALISLFLMVSLLHHQVKTSMLKLIHDKKIFLISMLILFTIISIPHSGSRSGFLILLLGVVVVAIKIFFRLKNSKANFSFLHLAPVLVLVVSTFSFPFLLSRETTKEMKANTLSQIKALSNDSPPLRFLLWKDLLDQIESSTMWGYGFDSYRVVNPIFQSTKVRNMRSYGLEFAHQKYTPLVGHGHNDYLEYVSEFGVLLFSILILYPLLVISKVMRNPSDFPKIGLLGCIAFLCFSFVDFPSRTPACLLLFCTALAICCKYSHLSTPDHSLKN